MCPSRSHFFFYSRLKDGKEHLITLGVCLLIGLSYKGSDSEELGTIRNYSPLEWSGPMQTSEENDNDKAEDEN